jgi:salicylate hydroxylase
VHVDEAEDEGVILCFQDSSKSHADALIGADGVHGHVRKHVLGAEHPALKPTFAGFWDFHLLVPIQKARETLGEEYFKEDRQYGWSGDGGFFMHDVLDNGESVQCVSSAMTDREWSPDEWKIDLDRKALEDSFASWTNSPISGGMIEVSHKL